MSRVSSLVGTRGAALLSGSSWSLAAKLCAVANLLVSVPVVLGALGPERFGAWAVLASVMAVATFLDFGVGYGVMNRVARAHALADHAGVAATIREGRALLVAIAALCLPLALVLVITLPWNNILGLDDTERLEAHLSALIVLAAAAISIVPSMSVRILLAIGRGNLAFKWQALSQLAALGVTVAMAESGANLPLLSTAIALPPLLAGLCSMASVHRMQILLAQASAAFPTLRATLMRDGGLFFVIQMSATAAIGFDLILVSTMLGSQQTTEFAVSQRLFTLIAMGLALVWLPLWPIYAQSIGRGDVRWALATLKKMSALAAAFAVGSSAFIIYFFDSITMLWLGVTIDVSPWLLFGFAMWSTLEALGGALATLLNAAGELRALAVLGLLFAVVSLTAKVLLVSTLGSAAVPWITALSYLLACAIPLLLMLPRLLSRVRAGQTV